MSTQTRTKNISTPTRNFATFVLYQKWLKKRKYEEKILESPKEKNLPYTGKGAKKIGNVGKYQV